ncbi:hypothetical protein PN441_20310 [Spirulina major CS-329]|uniref:hypothetical protein n=1 Tax=Spirulina TaxID=1154 RepID=UPI00232DD7DA|nr:MULTISPECIES: hypothetical protein [Spirulina]MDB9493713.1 hypothetical protein [Spirulina subsalsa CS-330]MDB9505428.1 hypothetical protein [Spirulina major CS-329]
MTKVASEWTTMIGSAGEDRAQAIATDAAGVSYVTGYQVSEAEEETAPRRWAWVASYDAQGALRWRQGIESDHDLEPRAIALDPGGLIYLAGTAYARDPEATNAPTAETWLAQLDTQGTVQWFLFLSSIHPQQPSSLTLDPRGDLYLTGFMTPSGQPGEAWLGKYAPNGDRLWWTSLGQHHDTATTRVVIGEDPTARTKFAKITVYVAGNTLMPIAERADAHDSWLARYSSEGIQRWIVPIGDAIASPCATLQVNRENHVFLAGTTTQSLTADPLTEHALWFAQYAPDGTPVTLQQWADVGCLATFVAEGDRFYLIGSSTDTTAWISAVTPTGGNLAPVSLGTNGQFCMDATFASPAQLYAIGYTAIAEQPHQAWIKGVTLA